MKMEKNVKYTKLMIVVFLISISGCLAGTMLDGQIVNTSDGNVMPMQIEMSHGTGAITAYSPEAGEHFTGQYTGVRGANKHNLANTKAILKGDKGTVLDISMLIEPGMRPKGVGEATDNHGNRYQVQF